MTISVKYGSGEENTMNVKVLKRTGTATALFGLLAVLVPSVAGASVPAMGTVTCPVVSGSGHLNPGLTAAGTSGSVKIAFTAILGSSPVAGCSGSAMLPTGAPVTITGGILTGTGYYSAPAVTANADSCANFDGPDNVGTISIKVKWAAKPAIAPSKVQYKLGSPTVSGASTDTISLPSAATLVSKHGSFATPALPNSVKLVTNIPSTCPATSAPFTSFTISGGSVSL